MPESYLKIAVGLLLLCVGRRLFWLFVAAVGFVMAGHMAGELLAHQPETLRLLVAVGAGLVGALIAIFLQKVAIALAGFTAGGYFLMIVLGVWAPQCPEWISFAVGGIVGTILMIMLFEWALIIFSSATGAHLIVYSIHMHRSMASIGFVVLCVVGIMIQARLVGPAPRGKPQP